MITNAKNVYLVSGQMTVTISGGREEVLPHVEQRVVVAEDARLAYECLATNEARFRPLGHATLHDYEDAAKKIRATLKGELSDWRLFVA